MMKKVWNLKIHVGKTALRDKSNIYIVDDNEDDK